MLFALPNLVSQVVAPVEPWNTEVVIPAEIADNKIKYREWCLLPTTYSCHYSAVEGRDPARRVGADNPEFLMHGLVADYDASVQEADLIRILSKSPTEFLPTWGCITFSYGGRLVWNFSKPIPLASRDCTKRFLELAAKKLKLNKLLPGFDYDAFVDPTRYYARGRNWIRLSADPIPASHVAHWMYEAGSKCDWNRAGVRIPVDLVAEEVRSKFPGRWSGEFTEGARGIRFWDPMADNATAAVVRSSGMQCFTGSQGFVSWSEIFGPAFVEKFQASSVGHVVDALWFDGVYYWSQQDGEWVTHNKEDLRLMLRVKYGLSAGARKDNCSEVDRVIHSIQVQKRIVAAVPFVHFPPGLLIRDNQKYLNTATVSVMQPSAEPAGGWGERFPWIAKFLDGFFVPGEQLDYFLAWWRRAYQGGITGSPESGQVVFIAGPPGSGKTFLSSVLLSQSLGGHADGSNYLLGEDRFTSHILRKPIITVDDSAPSANPNKRNLFSAMVKKMAANQFHIYEEKFHAAAQTVWLGRVVVTCNLDHDSLRILPNIETSIVDKLSLFRCRYVPHVFIDRVNLLSTVQRELPHFLSWLLAWDPPKHVVGTSRFGVRPYHHQALFSISTQSSPSYAFYELLTEFLASQKAVADSKVWCGTATRLFSDLGTFNSAVAKLYSPHHIGAILGQLKGRGFEINVKRNGNVHVWEIPYDLNLGDVTAAKIEQLEAEAQE